MNGARVKKDFKYILLNCIINKIPSWTIRRFCYKKLGLQIGKNSRIGIKTVIDEPKKIKIGDRTVVNEYCHLDGRGGLVIGDDVSISIYTKILTASHHKNSGSFEYYEGPVSIENRVWTGISAIILDNSVIRNNSIIGGGCVFKGQAEENGIYVGNPAKKITERTLEKEYQLSYHPYFR